MATTTSSPPEGQSVLPIITCPACGKHMRLSTVMPEEDHLERMTFICECGFDYRQSTTVGIERHR
jgi:C4-type Zn-finger protein